MKKIDKLINEHSSDYKYQRTVLILLCVFYIMFIFYTYKQSISIIIVLNIIFIITIKLFEPLFKYFNKPKEKEYQDKVSHVLIKANKTNLRDILYYLDTANKKYTLPWNFDIITVSTIISSVMAYFIMNKFIDLTDIVQLKTLLLLLTSFFLVQDIYYYLFKKEKANNIRLIKDEIFTILLP